MIYKKYAIKRVLVWVRPALLALVLRGNQVFKNIARQSAILVVAASATLATAAQAQDPAVQATPDEAASQGMTLPGCEWSLPCETKLDSAGQRRPATAAGTRLTGSVTQWNIDGDFSQLVDVLLDGALGADPKFTKADHQLAHFRKGTANFISGAKDAAAYLVPIRGFALSSEAADVILDEKIKVKDKASAEYARQRILDDVHPQLVAKTMQLAMAVGTKDAVQRDEAVSNAVASLSKLVGPQRAQLALSRLDEWGKLQFPDSAFRSAPAWDVETYQQKTRLVTKLAMDGDPVMQEIVNHLKKYNHQTRAGRISGHAVPAALSIASFATPGYVIPAALELIEAGYIMATGGTEESKLVKELYYDKRVESRYRTLNEEAQLALAQYQNAVNLKNPALVVCCESVLTQLVGPENLPQVLGRTLLSHQIQADPKTMTATSRSQAVQ